MLWLGYTVTGDAPKWKANARTAGTNANASLSTVEFRLAELSTEIADWMFQLVGYLKRTASSQVFEA